MEFSDSQYNFMRQSKDGCVIPKDDQRMVYRLSQMDLVAVGHGAFCETAKLSPYGRRELQREETRRSPVRRTLRFLAGPLLA